MLINCFSSIFSELGINRLGFEYYPIHTLSIYPSHRDIGQNSKFLTYANLGFIFEYLHFSSRITLHAIFLFEEFLKCEFKVSLMP